MRTACLIALPLLFACTGSTEPLGGGDDAGTAADAGAAPDAGSAACAALDEPACGAAGCNVKRCPGCFGAQLYAGCWGAGDPEPPCPDIDCPTCADLDEARCLEAEPETECRAVYCPTCDGTDTFAGCTGPGSPAPACPPVACACPDYGERTCIGDPGCHAVYLEREEPCACDAPGCCHEFVRCAEGGRADCVGEDLACRRMPPYCDGPYVVSYEGACYEGCVRREACEP